MRGPLPDHYLVLGVARVASSAEIRRAFRTLALRFHPDRAGQASTVTFQRIAEAYAVLSDPNSRAAYDGLRERAEVSRAAPQRSGPRRTPATDGAHDPGVEEGMYEGPGGRIGWRRARRYTRSPERPEITRLCGSLTDLVAREIARRGRDGIVEITITRAEAEQGGVAAIDARVTVVCPTCAGLAERDVLWCTRCQHAGTILDDVTFHLSIPPAVRDRTVWTFTTDPSGQSPPLRLRVRIADASGRSP